MSKLNKKQPQSIISATLQSKKQSADTDFGNFKVSFQYLDNTQKFGSSFRDWQSVGLLSKMLDVFQGMCCRTLPEQVDGSKFTIYGDFPPADRTYFMQPAAVPEDAKWARIHVTGPAIVAGHVVQDTFYIVFLDKTTAAYQSSAAIRGRACRWQRPRPASQTRPRLCDLALPDNHSASPKLA
ncbi:MAG: hypothetical protein EOO37_02370 [Cytophagaceae bacterium]|nr:MAG: hypothetical protein EOO37_02370 [Cytophagaceae bacterium]